MPRIHGRVARGVAAVELAITIIPMLILALGVAEFGRAFYTYNTIAKSARDAARFLTAPPPGITNPEKAAANLVVYGRTTASGGPLAPDLTVDQVKISYRSDVLIDGGGAMNVVTVSVTGYVYHSMVNYLVPDTINFNNISVTMRANS